ncbi:MAG: PEP-CTERM sorting domain-containing protein [Phycisphaeraceae bacterium]|nr:PEP-CTERM sorting domain-containing protein [Phycisphaeraceae bacterium]
MKAGYLSLCVVMACAVSSSASALLSDNIIQDGDFENLSGLKLADSPRTLEEMYAGTNPVRSWQFHPGGIAAENAGGYVIGQPFSDLGKWIGEWGINTASNPRSPETIPSMVNRSIVQRDGQPTGIMEGAGFRSWVTQVVTAPVGHTAGPAVIDFDYWFNQWETNPGDADSIFHVWVGGLNQADLPTWQDRAGPLWGGETTDSNWTNLAPLWDSPDWNTWGWNGIGADKPDVGSQGLQWHIFSMTNPAETTFNIATPYDYYYISVWQCVYAEAHPYFWLYGGKPTDRMAVAIDNVSLQVSVVPEPSVAILSAVGMLAILRRRR